MALLAMLLPVSAHAQDAQAKLAWIESAWAHAESRCNFALSDPAAFLDGQTADRYYGVDPIFSTEDGAMVDTRQYFDGISEVITYLDIDGQRFGTCSVVAQIDAGEIDPLISGAEWNDAFQSFLQTQPDLSPVGGMLDVTYVNRVAGQTFSFPETRWEYRWDADWGYGPVTGSFNSHGNAMFAFTRTSEIGDGPWLADMLSATPSDAQAETEDANASAAETTEVDPDIAAAQTNFGLATDLCLTHVRDRNPVEAFRAAGFEVTPTDEGGYSFATFGVSGFLSPQLLTGWCWVGSEMLTYQQAETIAYERALFRYPQGVSGPAERGWSIEIAPGSDCSGLTVLNANRVHTLIMTNVPHWEGCDSPDTGAVYFN